MSTEIRNQRPGMDYRRFGATGVPVSVITLGGMRWHDEGGDGEAAPPGMRAQCARITRAALDAGINLIETAKGYGRSEACYGAVLAEELADCRGRWWLMTKGNAGTAREMREMVEGQLRRLRVDRIDFYAWHGINTPELCERALASGGPVEELLRLRDQGRIGHVGFSTHGPTPVICRAIESGRFAFVNLHYYYFMQRNAPAVALAGARDLGVFIISPNDKGGHLYDPPPLLRDLCAPATPIQFNARWCLQTPQVHTLTFGMTETSHLDEMRGICPAGVPLARADREALLRLDGRLLVDLVSAYDGHEFAGDPSGINIPDVLRLRRMWKCYDMLGFARWRYNMFEEKGHWFPGAFATPERVALVEARRAPPGIDIRALLTEAHAALYRPKA